MIRNMYITWVDVVTLLRLCGQSWVVVLVVVVVVAEWVVAEWVVVVTLMLRSRGTRSVC